MSATNTTTHYNLPSFVATDKPAWLVDWNGAMASIDAGIYQAQQTADTAGTDVSALQNSLTTLSGTVDSQGVTISTLSQSLTTAIGNINTINSLIGNGTPTTTDHTIIGAINEINARTGEAEGISYDNTDSGLTATNVQGAIDENANTISGVNTSLTWVDITSQCEFNSGLTYVYKKILARKGEVQIDLSIAPTNWTNGAFLVKLPNDIPTLVHIPGISAGADGLPINEQTFIVKPTSGDSIDKTLIGSKSANAGYFICTLILAYDN